MNPLKQLGLDAVVAVGLVLALAAVYGLDRGPRKSDDPDAPVTTVKRIGSGSAEARPLRVAVTRGPFDDMGRLLKDDLGYKFDLINQLDLEDPKKIADYDIVFITCGPQPDEWLDRNLGAGDRPGVTHATWNPAARQRVRDSLRQYVQKGGTIYASDFILLVVNAAFPEFVDEPNAIPGLEQELVAEVVDQGLKDRLKSAEMHLKFDMRGWFPAALKGSEMKVYLKGRYRTATGGTAESPLLVKVPFGKGSIIYTSFHNEKQNSDKEKELLKYLVFATVTASAESEATRTMIKGGFSPQKSNLLTAAPGAQQVTQTYTCKKDGKLQFALAFNNEGAKLRLEVKRPNGPPLVGEGTSSFIIEVPDAKAGEYTYTVTALTVPYANFPFSLTVGEQ